MTLNVPPPRPRRGWRTGGTIIAIVAGALVLCCGGIGVAGFAAFRGIEKAGAPLRSTADTYLHHLEASEDDAAYGQLCATTRERYSREQFGIVVAATRPVRHRIVGFDARITNGHRSGTVDASVTQTNGSTQTITVRLDTENGAWKVCSPPS